MRKRRVAKRVIALLLCALMTLSLLSGLNFGPAKVNRAAAAGGEPIFDEEAFGKAYAKVLLSQLGKGYPRPGNATDNHGYHVADISSATPFNPTTIQDTRFDCFGLVITGLMAMGYTGFRDESGRSYPFSVENGGQVFESVYGILYNHATGDYVTLVHHDSKYNVLFQVGEIVRVDSLTDVKPGTILLNVADKKDATIQTGPFSDGKLGLDTDPNYGISHASVALFALERNKAYDDLNATTCYQNIGGVDNYARAMACLEESYTKAKAKLLSLFGDSYKSVLETGKTYSNPYYGGTYYVPNLWDARGRGFRTASSLTDYLHGFNDGDAAFHFGTPYSNIWQIEAIGSGVSVNNNPYGKYNMAFTVSLKPVFSYGDIVIKKTDAENAAKLSGATFMLYEWSESKKDYVDSTYIIKENSLSKGEYRIYNDLGDLDEISYTSENQGKVRVVETKAPTGYTNIDPKTNKPYQWDVSFVNDGETHTIPIDAKNYPEKGSVQITKTLDKAATVDKTFWFRISGGPSGNTTTKWTSITLTAGKTSGTATIAELPVGSYTVGEVSANNSAAAPTNGDAFPYSIENPKNVTVTANTTAPVTMKNTLDVGSVSITKNIDKASTVDHTFWFLISGGPDGYKTDKWVSITIAAGKTSGTATVSDLPIGAYTVSEVSGNNSTTAPTKGDAFPYKIESPKNVTVTKGATAPATMTNTLDTGSLQVTKSVNVAATENKTFWFYVAGGATGNKYEKWVSVSVTAGQKSGAVTLTGLPIGAYTVSEVSGDGSKTAPTSSTTFPYTIESSKNITVSSGATAPVTMTNTLDKGNLQITKSLDRAATVDKTFWFLASGGPSGYKTNKWVSITITAGQTSGTATVTDLPIGAYTVSEVAADGSTAAPVNGVGFPFTIEDAKNISVTKGATAPVTLTNTLDEGEIKITKSISKAATIDETFWFLVEGGADGYKTEKWVSITVVAGQLTGTATITGLSIGNYSVSEVSGDGSKDAPGKSSAFPFEIEGAKNVAVTKGATAPVTMTNTINVGKLKITKSLNVPAIEDDEFWFYVVGGPDGYQTEKWVSIKVAAGETVGEVELTDIPVDTYTIDEVVADGSKVLAKSSETFPFAVIGGGDVTVVVNETATIEFRNEIYSAALSIHKTDAESGAAMSGIEFGVYADAACKAMLQKLTTDENGNATSARISLGKVASGTVYVKELKTDSRHVLDEEVVKVDLVHGETAAVKNGNWTNKPVKGQIVVKKTGEFFTSVITTDSKYGTVYAPQFTYGQLEGAQFSVFNKADVKVNADGTFSYDLAKAVTTFTTKTNGGESDYIPLGAYYVIETKAPTGYVLEDVLHEVIIEKESETKEIVLKDVKSQNDYQDTSVIIYKEAEYLITTEDNGIIRTTVQVMPGEGFIFGLYAKTEYTATDGKKIPADGLVAYGSTDENGELVFDAQLPHGVYYVKELETLPDYIIDEDVYEVDLSYDADATEIVVEASEDALINRLRTTPVTITKRTLAGDDPLPGTEITIWDANGRVIFKELTGADGTVPAVVLLKGHNYTFQETYAPEGYAVLYQKIPFTVELDGTITGTTTIRDDVSRISFLKVDDDDKPLAGAEFTLYDENGLPIKSVISDENGIAEFTNLGYGKYAIIETQTPKGYSLSDFRYEIEIDGTYENKEPIKVVNHELPKTGVENPLLIILCFLLVAIVSIMAIFSKKKDSFVHVEEYYRQ